MFVVVDKRSSTWAKKNTKYKQRKMVGNEFFFFENGIYNFENGMYNNAH